MAKSQVKAYDAKWKRGERITGEEKEGNQGHAFLAKPIDQPEAVWNFVLKELRRQEDQDRRSRMRREVLAQQDLDHPGIPKVVDSNVEEYKSEVPLYLVTERVHGIDLYDFVRAKPPTIPDAAAIVKRVLKIVAHCHEKDVWHRDIKPSHIILRGEDPAKPTLIDYGLAFREVPEGEFETATEEGVGNRFIFLPEQTGGGPRPDSRSDIAQCVGLFFFLVTGKRPGIILDGQGKMPHQNIELPPLLSDLTEEQKRAFTRIFTKGFAYEMSKRWQTAKELSQELSRVTGEVTSPLDDFDDRVTTLKARAASDTRLADHEKFGALKRSSERMILQAIKRVAEHFTGVITINTSGSLEDFAKNLFGFNVTVHKNLDNSSSTVVVTNRVEDGRLFSYWRSDLREVEKDIEWPEDSLNEYLVKTISGAILDGVETVMR